MNFIKEEGVWIFAECMECGRIMKFRKEQLRLNKSTGVYRLNEPVECFCEEESDLICGVPVPQEISVGYVERNPVTRNVPRCPTCNSENITKISVGSKVAGGAMFGIFSSNVRKSYKCNNCGYKW